MPLGKPQPRYPGVNWRHPLASGLVGAWLVNEGAGSILYDVVNRNNATFNNMDPATDWVGNPYGGAIEMDGSDDWLSIPGNPSLNWGNEPISIAWGLSSNDSSLTQLFGFFAASGFDGWAIRFPSGSGVDWWSNNEAAWRSVHAGDVRTGVYHDFLLTIRNTEANFYLDGQLQTTTTGSTIDEPSANTDNKGLMGSTSGSQVSAGTLNYAMIWRNRVVSTAGASSLAADPFEAFRPDRVEILSAGVAAAADTISKIVGPGGLAGGHRLAGDGGGIAA